MNARQLVNRLLETDENIDWTPHPDDPPIPEPDPLKTVHVVGRNFYRAGGIQNTVDIFINGKPVVHLPIAVVVYSDSYLARALHWLKEQGYIPPKYTDKLVKSSRRRQSVISLAKKIGFTFTHKAYRALRKRDLTCAIKDLLHQQQTDWD